MRLPRCPMPHHRASKLVFRLSIAHYLLFVTKIISLSPVFSLPRPFAVAFTCAREGARPCIPGVFLTRMYLGSDHFDYRRFPIDVVNNKITNCSGAYSILLLFASTSGKYRVGPYAVRNLLADIETEHRAKRQFTGGT